MMNSVFTVADYLEINANSIATEIVDYSISKLDFELPIEVLEKARFYQTEFIKQIGVSISINDEEQLNKSCIEWNKKYGQQHEMCMLQNVSSIVEPFAGQRLYMNKMMTDISVKHGLTVQESAFILYRLNYILDVNVTESILYYENFTQENSRKQQEEIVKLSAPVVPIQKGIAVVPIIGKVDYGRTQHLMNEVVPSVCDLGIVRLILDFSGIVSIDSDVAGHVFDINTVLDLLGVDVLITGLRPDIVKSLVSQNIDFSSIKTYSTVQQALELLDRELLYLQN